MISFRSFLLCALRETVLLMQLPVKELNMLHKLIKFLRLILTFQAVLLCKFLLGTLKYPTLLASFILIFMVMGFGKIYYDLL